MILARLGRSADGNIAVVGGPYDNGDTGAAWVFIRSGGVWTQQGSKLVGTDFVGDAFGLGTPPTTRTLRSPVDRFTLSISPVAFMVPPKTKARALAQGR